MKRPKISDSNKISLTLIFAITGLISACDPAEKFKSEITKKISDKYSDPDSVKFRNLELRPDLGYACGELNAKNVSGGYGGYSKFFAKAVGSSTGYNIVQFVTESDVRNFNSTPDINGARLSEKNRLTVFTCERFASAAEVIMTPASPSIVALKNALSNWEPIQVQQDTDHIAIYTPSRLLNNDKLESLITYGVCAPVLAGHSSAKYLQGRQPLEISGSEKSPKYSTRDAGELCVELLMSPRSEFGKIISRMMIEK